MKFLKTYLNLIEILDDKTILKSLFRRHFDEENDQPIYLGMQFTITFW